MKNPTISPFVTTRLHSNKSKNSGKNWLLFFAWNIVFSILFIETAYAEQKPILNIESWQTKNGSRVLFVANKQIPMVDINVVFDAGSARDKNNFGLANFTSRMLNQGTSHLNANEIAANFANVGAIYRTETNRDMTIINLRSLTNTKFLEPALTTFSDLLNHPVFPKEAFQRIQKNLFSQLQIEQQSPIKVAQKKFLQILYAEHPYGHDILGNEKILEKFSPVNLRDFYQRYYVAKNNWVIIVGDLEKNQAMKVAEQIVGQLPVGEKPNNLPLPKTIENTEKVIRFPSEQTTILLGGIGIAKGDKDFFPLLVGNYTLGGGQLVSRFFQEVRNKNGLTYNIQSDFINMKVAGPFIISLQTREEKAQQALNITKKVLADFIATGPTVTELTAAKKSIIGSFPRTFANNKNTLQLLTTIGFYNLPLNYLDTFRDNINAVTKEQIQAAFNEHIQLNRMLTVKVNS